MSNESSKNVSEVIWNEIKDKQVEVFALPAQPISNFCKVAVVEPSKLYLVSTASSFLPTLEAALGPKYKVELADKYISVSKV